MAAMAGKDAPGKDTPGKDAPDKDSYDVIVVGGGPGGYVAAIRAAQLGMKAALIEAEHLGGICLNWGCIPTKALLRAGEINHLLHNLEPFGFAADNPRFDMGKLVARSRKVADQLSRGVAHLLAKNGVAVIEGWARLTGGGGVDVTRDGERQGYYEAAHIILATGARPRILDHLKPDGTRIWTYKEAMIPETMPDSVLVIGSGAIGIEFASFYRQLGADVTVVEMLDRIVPNEDPEISGLAEKQFRAQGIDIRLSAKVTGLASGEAGVTATIEDKDGKTERITTERAILAIGVVANTEEIGLENTAARVENGGIRIDEWQRTDEPGLYAIGDVARAPWLAHKASHEGVICVEAIAGLDHVEPLTVARIPACTYCSPQIASVGMTEPEAEAAGHELRVGRFPFRGNGKALALGEPEGLVKTIFDARTGALLGAHMIGAEVTELIQGYAIAQSLETTEAELMHTIFPHPTLSETMHESVLDAYDRVIHY